VKFKKIFSSRGNNEEC